MNTNSKQNPLPRINKQTALAAIPVQNNEVSAEVLPSGQILIRYPVTMRPGLAKWFRRFKGTSPQTNFRKLQLDNLGTDVWQMIDGKRTVQEIIDKFAQIHQLQGAESESAITQFLRDLGKRGLIGMQE
jgi:hypothetical protein